MNNLHHDPVTGRRVLVAEQRALRPHETASDTQRVDCPFCAGHESLTPAASYEDNFGEGGWRVRVVPNKYPAVDLSEAAHEVVIESPRHLARSGELDAEQMQRVLVAYARRLAHWATDPRLAYRLLFKNVGASAGASLSHLHSQLIALPEIPPLVAAEITELSRLSGCPWCDRIAQEAVGPRVVAQTDAFLAWCPEAGRQPMETHIAPLTHASRYEDIVEDAQRLAQLANLLLNVLTRIEHHLGNAGYNLMIQTAPAGAPQNYHWRIEIVPRLAQFAGLELATGLFVNTMSAEHAAKRLRNSP